MPALRETSRAVAKLRTGKAHVVTWRLCMHGYSGLVFSVLLVGVVLQNATPGLADLWGHQWLPESKIRVLMACSGIRFVPRFAWGARPPRNQEWLKVQPVPRFFVHHTEGPECFNFWTCSERMRHWQNFHMDTRDTRWYDLGYNFLIGGDGLVYVSRGWDVVGKHTKEHNNEALAAAVIGDFSRHLPTPRALWALKKLLQCGVALGKIRPNYTLHGHRDGNCRKCPGDALYAYIRRWRQFGGRLQKYICEMPLTRAPTYKR